MFEERNKLTGWIYFSLSSIWELSINQSKASGFQIAKLAYLSIRPTYYINYDYNE